VELAQGRTVGEICRGSRPRRRPSPVGGLEAGQVRRLEELERENGQLKRAVAGLMLDQQILKEAVAKTFQSALLTWSGLVA
jgi:hypothetical protein